MVFPGKAKREYVSHDVRKSQIDSILLRANAYALVMDRSLKMSTQETDVQQPKEITGGDLREYQLQGLQWMAALYENGLSGILGDEMGLGKTLQTISLTAYLREINGEECKPMLVVAPLSTLGNWRDEYHRFAPGIPVIVYHGTKAERNKMRQERFKPGGMTPGTVVICSYQTIISDCRTNFKKFEYECVVVDEGHRLKSPHSKLMHGFGFIRSDFRLLLTGTPLQNNLVELASLLRFILPNLFPDVDLLADWFNGLNETTNVDNMGEAGEDGTKKDYSEVAQLHTIIRPFLLRRLKRDVKNLAVPAKAEVYVYVPLGSAQQRLYHGGIYNGMSEMVKILDEELYGDLEDSVRSGNQRVNLSSASQRMVQLRKICQSANLYTRRRNPQGWEIPLTKEQAMLGSAKVAFLSRILPKLFAQQRKVVMFSQLVMFLDVVEDFLIDSGVKYSRFDGSTTFEQRNIAIDSFREDPDNRVFLLSTRSGGLGLNLVEADTVIILDSDWNPQQDLQAQDRCHRIGQRNNVLVMRLMTPETVEVRMNARANGKRRLERLVMADAEQKSRDVADAEDLPTPNTAEETSVLSAADVDKRDSTDFKLKNEDIEDILATDRAAFEALHSVDGVVGEEGVEDENKRAFAIANSAGRARRANEFLDKWVDDALTVPRRKGATVRYVMSDEEVASQKRAEELRKSLRYRPMRTDQIRVDTWTDEEIDILVARKHFFQDTSEDLTSYGKRFQMVSHTPASSGYIQPSEADRLDYIHVLASKAKKASVARSEQRAKESLARKEAVEARRKARAEERENTKIVYIDEDDEAAASLLAAEEEMVMDSGSDDDDFVPPSMRDTQDPDMQFMNGEDEDEVSDGADQ